MALFLNECGYEILVHCCYGGPCDILGIFCPWLAVVWELLNVVSNYILSFDTTYVKIKDADKNNRDLDNTI